MTRWLLTVLNEDQVVLGPYCSERSRMRAAKRLALDAPEITLMWMNVDGDRPTVGRFGTDLWEVLDGGPVRKRPRLCGTPA